MLVSFRIIETQEPYTNSSKKKFSGSEKLEFINLKLKINVIWFFFLFIYINPAVIQNPKEEEKSNVDIPSTSNANKKLGRMQNRRKISRVLGSNSVVNEHKSGGGNRTGTFELFTGFSLFLFQYACRICASAPLFNLL